MNEAYGTLIRASLKVVGGAVVAKGYGDEAALEAIIGAAMTIVGIVWGIAASKKAAVNRQTIEGK